MHRRLRRPRPAPRSCAAVRRCSAPSVGAVRAPCHHHRGRHRAPPAVRPHGHYLLARLKPSSTRDRAPLTARSGGCSGKHCRHCAGTAQAGQEGSQPGSESGPSRAPPAASSESASCPFSQISPTRIELGLQMFLPEAVRLPCKTGGLLAAWRPQPAAEQRTAVSLGPDGPGLFGRALEAAAYCKGNRPQSL